MNEIFYTSKGLTGNPPLYVIPEHCDLRCPQCEASVTHLQAELYEPPRDYFVPEIWSQDAPEVTGWLAVPCMHSVSARKYELWITSERRQRQWSETVEFRRIGEQS